MSQVKEVDFVPVLAIDSEKKGLPLWLKSLAGRQPSFSILFRSAEIKQTHGKYEK